MLKPDYAGASAPAIQHHYDLDPRFFALWLDSSLTYSCALWEGAETLEAAQARKLDHMIAGAGVAHGGRVLDVGCGWGSLMERLVGRYPSVEAVGLTLSASQARWVAERALPRCTVRLENWTAHESSSPYSAIISVGAFEHFAQEGLSRQARVDAYRQFFDRCHRLLGAGGRLALQTNGKGNNVHLDRSTVAELRFICDTIFPESELPWLSEIVQASERLFELRGFRNDPEHYARTCAEWHRRLRANRERAVELVGEAVVQDYERYLGSTVGHFERGHLALFRLFFERV